MSIHGCRAAGLVRGCLETQADDLHGTGGCPFYRDNAVPGKSPARIDGAIEVLNRAGQDRLPGKLLAETLRGRLGRACRIPP